MPKQNSAIRLRALSMTWISFLQAWQRSTEEISEEVCNRTDHLRDKQVKHVTSHFFSIASYLAADGFPGAFSSIFSTFAQRILATVANLQILQTKSAFVGPNNDEM